MDAWQSIEVIEQQYKIRALDSSIRRLRRRALFPSARRKTTLKVFDGVLEYPLASDHDELVFLDNQPEGYSGKARFLETDFKQLYENVSGRNQLTDQIWDNGTQLLGVRYKDIPSGSVLLNNAEVVSEWTASGTASSPTLDKVTFKEGDGSIKFTVTAGTATMQNTLPNDQTDGDYKKKYHFKLIYLDAVPTSITMRYHVDAFNYLETTGITTQFAGQALKADDWNLIAQDLNAATATGTIATTPTFTFEEFDLVGAGAGTYFVDTSYVRQWELLDYWYYSKNYVATVGETTANQEYFYNSSEVALTDSQLVSETEWADVCMYDALYLLAADFENQRLQRVFERRRDEVWDDLMERYPMMIPHPITLKYRFADPYESVLEV